MRYLIVPVLVSFVGLSVCAADAPPKPEELKVLDRLVGEWTTQAVSTTINGQPQNIQHTGTAVRKWALDGRIVEEDGVDNAGHKVRVIFTYDAQRKAYRWWYFGSAGGNFENSGQWDPASQCFNFQIKDENAVTTTATIRFISDDLHEWHSKSIDAAGKVLYEGGGKLMRKK